MANEKEAPMTEELRELYRMAVLGYSMEIQGLELRREIARHKLEDSDKSERAKTVSDVIDNIVGGGKKGVWKVMPAKWEEASPALKAAFRAAETKPRRKFSAATRKTRKKMNSVKRLRTVAPILEEVE